MTNLTINHVRDHHHLIHLIIGKFEGRFSRFDIECHHHRFRSRNSFLDKFDRELPVKGRDVVP